jgi:hypothetical protein
MTFSKSDGLRYFLECVLFTVALYAIVLLVLPVDLTSMTLTVLVGFEFAFLLLWKEYRGYELSVDR